MFTTAELASHVEKALNADLVAVPNGHTVAIVAIGDADRATLVMAVKKDNWEAQAFVEYDFQAHEPEAGVILKASW